MGSQIPDPQLQARQMRRGRRAFRRTVAKGGEERFKRRKALGDERRDLRRGFGGIEARHLNCHFELGPVMPCG